MKTEYLYDSQMNNKGLKEEIDAKKKKNDWRLKQTTQGQLKLRLIREPKKEDNFIRFIRETGIKNNIEKQIEKRMLID